MQSIREMIFAHPHVRGADSDALLRAVETAGECAAICFSCADACLGEAGVQDLMQCIRLNLDCAEVCRATAAIAARRSGGNVPVIRAMLEACVLACRRCGEECQRHAQMMEHCALCAAACGECESACRQAAEGLTDSHHPAAPGSH
jgi:hypothetical protein